MPEELVHPLVRSSQLSNALHATCPPEDDCPGPTTQSTDSLPNTEDERSDSSAIDSGNENGSQPQASAGAAEPSHPSMTLEPERRDSSADTQENMTRANGEALVNSADEINVKPASTQTFSPSLLPPPSKCVEGTGYGYMPQHTSSFLKHGSRFVGTQHSDRQVYNVSVELKYVDMRESFLCGYLRIEGLTDSHPTLTTYFEGEIIGNKYTFQTRHEGWGSNIKIDMQHWNKFPAWRPLARAAQSSTFSYRDYAEREALFMRWKEHFLVPDHRVKSISGASFEGFYYICFNQVHGTIEGIYFHSKSEKFQKLELKHVHDSGCKTAMEFA